MSDLKPCPFCHKKACDDRGGDVHCADEKCPGWNMRLCSSDKWNTRADLPLPTDQLFSDPRVKALVEALAYYATDESAEGWYAIAALAQLKEPKE